MERTPEQSRATRAPITAGRIEVICGCMFSGKTSALLERIARAQAVGYPIHAFKHASDTRYDGNAICSHAGGSTHAVPIGRAQDIEPLVDQPGLIAVDEGQFFDEGLPQACQKLAKSGHAVVIAGLDLDCWGLAFEAMRTLIGLADQVTSLTAHCAVCGRPATRTQRIAPLTGDSMVGGPVAYEPRCVGCFVAPPMTLRR